MPFATNTRPTDAGVAIQMPPRVVAVPMKPGSTSSDPAAPTPSMHRKRFLVTFWLLFSILGAFVLAMYINVLNSFPEFVDEAGNSTIDVSIPACRLAQPVPCSFIFFVCANQRTMIAFNGVYIIAIHCMHCNTNTDLDNAGALAVGLPVHQDIVRCCC